MKPSNSFLQSHHAGDAQQERDRIAWRTTKFLLLFLVISLIVFAAVNFIYGSIHNSECNSACVETGIMDSGFSEADPTQFFNRYCVCRKRILLERVHEFNWE